MWTERTELAPAMMALNDAEFAQEIALRFGDALGAIAVAGPRWAYPLSLLQADRYTAPRLALIGDAAHVIHPIAGQGLNLGLRDVAALAECIVDARRLGLDIGAADVLERYARWRRFDNLALMAVTDGLNRLFSTDLAPVRLVRDLGLGLGRACPAQALLHAPRDGRGRRSAAPGARRGALARLPSAPRGSRDRPFASSAARYSRQTRSRFSPRKRRYCQL